ncbi:MAG: DUF4232 domain-containing protein [Solirubrobacteraceae bacterium]
MRLPAVVLAGLMFAACGGSSASSSGAASVHTSTASAASTTTATLTTTATSTATGSGTTPGSASGPPACRAATLALSFLGQQGATGHGELGFALRNVSATSCRSYGYPGVLFLDRHGAPLPTTPTRTTHDFFGAVPVAPLVVAPGSSVSFRLGVTHQNASSASIGCTVAYGLQVIAPDDTVTLRMPIGQGAYECASATVSPLSRGHSAYP